MQIVHGLRFDNIRGDIYGGLTAAVVALPLALAFGVASGAGALAGLYGAIFVGFFAALFGGTPSQVSGPTGPMTVVMAGVITQYAHEPAMAFTVVMLAGLFQIGFGLMRIGRYINLVPFPVVSGFMTGIGCIIVILQLAPLVGHEGPGGGVLATALALPAILSAPHWPALAIGAGALAVVLLWPGRLQRLLPGPLVALVAGTLAALFLFPDVPAIGDIPTGFPAPHLPTFTLDAVPDMVGSALVLGLLGAIDSLLTSLVADNITQTHHASNRELVGQGIGNAVAGLFGAIPGAGATMRTVVNVRSGGRTPISGALHALVLLAVVLGLGGLAAHIPHAVLAGILVKVGIDIVDWGYLKRIHRAPFAGVAFMLVVLGLTVFVDLITAVGVGVVLASLLFVKRMADLQLANIQEVTGGGEDSPLTEREAGLLAAGEGRVVLYHLRGPFSFGAAKDMGRRVGGASQYDVLVLDFTEVSLLDTSALLSVEDVIKLSQGRGQAVVLCGLSDRERRTLERLGVLALLPTGRVCASRAEALETALGALAAPSQEGTGHAAPT